MIPEDQKDITTQWFALDTVDVKFINTEMTPKKRERSAQTLLSYLTFLCYVCCVS